MNKPTSSLFLHSLAIGIGALLAQNAQSQGVVYNNSTTFAGNFAVNNNQAGNEVVLAGSATSDFISQLQFQFDLVSTGANPFSGTPTGNEQVELTLYKNDGSTVAGYKSPSTVVYSSGFSTMSSIGLGTFTQGTSLTYNPNVTVPKDFTWTVTFANVPGGESAGLSLYNQPGGPTVGQNFGDAWYNNGSGWTLNVANAGEPSLQFGAVITAVPEPGTISLGLVGACAFLARRRKV